VLVLAGERPAFAFEVRVTHAVEPEKEAALAAAGVPAVELDARGEWEREAGDGEGAVELVCARSLGFGPCPACQVRARADAERDRGGEAAQIAELEGYRARGLFRGARAERRGGGRDDPLSPGERAEVASAFRCPECGGTGLQAGERLLLHACDSPGDSPLAGRPVAWRAYDGSLVTLGWGVGKPSTAPGAGRKAR